MASKEYAFFQKLSINGAELSVENIMTGTYIERCDLSGPALTIQIRDSLTLIMDQYRIETGAAIELYMADVGNADGDSLTERFIVGRCSKDGDVINIDALQADCMALKTPAIKSQFFVDKAPAEIIRKLVPGLAVQSSITDAGTYHLNPGMTPSRLLRSMARDYAAAVYICRGKVHFVKLSELAALAPAYKLGTNLDRGAVDIVMGNAVRMDEKGLYQRQLVRSWYTFDNQGTLHSKAADGPPAFISGIPARRLESQNTFVLPRLDVTAIGFFKTQPGITLALDVKKFDEQGELDESVPAKLLLSAVSHYQRGYSYLNRFELSEVVSE